MHQKKSERVKQLIVIKMHGALWWELTQCAQNYCYSVSGHSAHSTPVCSKAGTQATCAEVKGGEKEKTLNSGVWTPADLGCHFRKHQKPTVS